MFLAILAVSAGSQVLLPAPVSQPLEQAGRPAGLDAQEPEKVPIPGGPSENDFLSGRSCMVNRDFQNARGHFTNYLKLNQVRTDSDLDLANLIGLGLACEALEDYRIIFRTK